MKNWLNGALATCSFELRRSFTFQRTSVSVVLALFPPVMLGLLIAGTEMSGDSQARSVMQDFTKLITVLMVSLVCLLSLLLWATPNVYSELEGKSWSFVASRPGGRISIFLGKFLAAFLVSLSISVSAISLCVLLASLRLGIEDPQGMWLAMCGVFLFACSVYAAVFSLIGTFFINRAMVVAAGYLIGSDIVMASIPGALINKITIRYHLQENRDQLDWVVRTWLDRRRVSDGVWAGDARRDAYLGPGRNCPRGTWIRCVDHRQP